MDTASRRALVMRIGALGDVLLTRRLTYSLSLAGFRSTLFAPARHASLLIEDPWIEGILDSESPSMAGASAGTWPEDPRGFELAVVISNSTDLALAAHAAAQSVLRIPPSPQRDDAPIARQWAEALGEVAPPFTEYLPDLATDPGRALFAGATLIHPGSGSARKNWPIERFVEVGRVLSNEGHRVVWVRGPADVMPPRIGSSFDRLDTPTLQALGATLAVSRLFIGNDSGVTHLAAAVGAPTLAVFGPTDALVWRPDGPRVQTLRTASGDLSVVQVAQVLTASRDLAGPS